MVRSSGSRVLSAPSSSPSPRFLWDVLLGLGFPMWKLSLWHQTSRVEPKALQDPRRSVEGLGHPGPLYSSPCSPSEMNFWEGKLSVANKAPGTEGQPQANGEKKETPPAVPSAPPSYEEATSGEGLKAGAFPPGPTAVPLHPSWAYVDPSSSNYESGFPSGGLERFTTFSWDDQKVRRVFIRKVYTILLIQLLVTLGVVALFTFCDPVKSYVQANPGWYWASYAVFFVTYLTLACCSGPRRHFPWNLILLTVFTLSMAYLTGMLSSYYNTMSVLLCLGITALVCLSVTMFSFQTKFDFTSCQGVLFVLLMTLFFSGLILAILLPFQYVPWLHAVYAVLGAGVFTLFLAFDTQLLMGNRRHSLSPEEYIFGALNIYLDIIYIFTFFLQIFGTNRD